MKSNDVGNAMVPPTRYLCTAVLLPRWRSVCARRGCIVRGAGPEFQEKFVVTMKWTLDQTK